MLSRLLPNVAARNWRGAPFRTQSKETIDSRFPRGIYKFCVSAKDAAGHQATSCVAYYIGDKYGR